jgi:hypothetical protein
MREDYANSDGRKVHRLMKINLSNIVKVLQKREEHGTNYYNRL